jgi:rSAM/selenodomain-associated transferase 1
VIAKAPAPGRAKTRLVPPLSPAEAAALQEAMLLDTLDACRAEAVHVAILHADPGETAELSRVAPGVPLVRQEGRGLGEALGRTLDRHVADGPVAIVSSDIPAFPAGSLDRAFALLDDGADIVLGPALDGGYWLIAMREFHAEPLREVPWSTPAVLAVTLERARAAGLRADLLDPWRDLDTAVDLAFLRRQVDELRAPRTAAALRSLELPEPPRLELAESELLSGSPWRAILHDRLRDGDGRETGYSYLAVPRAVFVVAVTADDELLLVRQYRHPVRDWTVEVPAGSLHDGETPLDAARRELAEETGGTADEWRHLTTFYSSSAHISLRSDAFLATGVEVGTAAPEDHEEVELVRVPLAEALERARAGGFSEGQTALAILLAAPYLNGSLA